MIFHPGETERHYLQGLYFPRFSNLKSPRFHYQIPRQIEHTRVSPGHPATGKEQGLVHHHLFRQAYER